MSRGYRPLLNHARRRRLPSRAGLTRRDLLRIGAAGLVAGLTQGVAGCRTGAKSAPPRPIAELPDAAGRSVIVVGGGLSGLACALALKQAGAEVTVLEVQPRAGGRVVTDHAMLTGHPVELGGEWIGENHPTWLALARRYDIQLVDAPEYEGDPPLVLEGNLLQPKAADELYEEIDAVLARLIEMARPIDPVRPFLSAGAAELDRQNVADFIRSQQLSPLGQRLMLAIEAADNGVPAERMSLLAYVAMIAGGGFENYYLISESYRTRNGNQQLADGLAAELGDALHFGQSVTRISRFADGATVQTRGGRRLRADSVVLTVPPSVWGQIEIEPSLAEGLAPQMGHNSKLLLGLRRPVWHDSSRTPELVSDGELVHLGWEARKDAETGNGTTVLTLFSGAESCDRLRRLEPRRRAAEAIREASAAFPGLADTTVKDVFVDWPAVPTARGSYSFPAPGQVMRQGPTLVDGLRDDGLAPLYFAGEHTSYGFAGYMEGALQSGLRAARSCAGVAARA